MSLIQRLKQLAESPTQDGEANTMQEIHQSDLQESRSGDIRAKFDSGFIPGAHKPATQLIQGVHGWIDNEGNLVPFDPYEVEITPESIDADFYEIEDNQDEIDRSIAEHEQAIFDAADGA